MALSGLRMNITQEEKDRVSKFLDDELLVEIIKKVLFEQFDLNKPIEGECDNETLGQITRARLEGKKLLEEGFRELKNFRKVEEIKKEINPAI